MGHADYYKSGTWNGICDRCGSKFKFSDLKLEWDGLYVCTANGCFENRQPQDYVKGVRDDMSVPVSRPDTTIFTDAITVTQPSTVSLSFFPFKNRMLTTSVSSSVNINTVKYTFTAASKVVNGAALNTTTLG